MAEWTEEREKEVRERIGKAQANVTGHGLESVYFAATSRTDLPDALEEIARLRTIIAAWEDLFPATSWKFEEAQKSLDTFVRGPLLRQIENLRTENDALLADVRKLREALTAAKCRCIKSTKKNCPDCGADLKWVGSGPGWMNSDQWDAVKAGDYFCLGTCSDPGTTSGRKYFCDSQLQYVSQACSRCVALADTAKWEKPSKTGDQNDTI